MPPIRFEPFRDCGPRKSKAHPTAYTKDELIAIAVSHEIPLTKAKNMTVGKLCAEIARLQGLPAPHEVDRMIAAQPAFVPQARFVPKERVVRKRVSAPEKLEGRGAVRGKAAVRAGYAPAVKAKATRAPSAYNMYMARQLPQYKAQHPGVEHKAAFTAVAHMWANAPENPKRK